MSQSAILNEGFEAGGKTSYAAANVALGSGSWYMSEALTGFDFFSNVGDSAENLIEALVDNL